MSRFNARELIELLKKSFDSAGATGVNAIVQLDLSGTDGGKWYMKVEDRKLEVLEGSSENADAEIHVSTDDLISLISGTLDPMKAFFLGKVKIKGDQSKVIKLISLFKIRSEDLERWKS